MTYATENNKGIAVTITLYFCVFKVPLWRAFLAKLTIIHPLKQSIKELKVLNVNMELAVQWLNIHLELLVSLFPLKFLFTIDDLQL